MVLLVLVSIIFRVKDLVSGSEMVDLLKATTIAFFGANGVEHIMTVVKDTLAARAGGEVKPSIPPGDNLVTPDEQEETSEKAN